MAESVNKVNSMAKAGEMSNSSQEDSEFYKSIEISAKLVSIIFTDFDCDQAAPRVENLGGMIVERTLSIKGVAGISETIVKFKEAMVEGFMHSSLDKASKMEAIKSVVIGIRNSLAHSVKHAGLDYEEAVKADEFAVRTLSNSSLKSYAEAWMDAVRKHISSEEFIQKVDAIKKEFPRKPAGGLSGLASNDAAHYLQKFSLNTQGGAAKPKGPSI